MRNIWSVIRKIPPSLLDRDTTTRNHDGPSLLLTFTAAGQSHRINAYAAYIPVLDSVASAINAAIPVRDRLFY
jgi:hypothetical protein